MENYSNRKLQDHTIHIRISSRLYEELKSLAIADERSVSGMIKFVVVQFLKKKLHLT